MAFVVCTLIMYILWWDKPFGVDRRTIITAITYEWNEDACRSLEPIRPSTSTPNLTFVEFFDISGDMIDLDTDGLKQLFRAFGGIIRHIFGRSNLMNPWPKATRSITFYVAGTLFSAFHIIAWNWDFPSPIVRLLWRTFALAATGTSPVVFLVFFLSRIITHFQGDSTTHDITLLIVAFSLSLIYIISRLALIVLIFYCFSSMPAGVYETIEWTKFLPHFS